MKKMYKTFEIYKFDELNQAGQDKAISDHVKFLLEITPDGEGSERFKRATREAEAMRTPWFAGEYVLDYCKEEIIKTIRLSEYSFLADGSFISTVDMQECNNLIPA